MAFVDLISITRIPSCLLHLNEPKKNAQSCLQDPCAEGSLPFWKMYPSFTGKMRVFPLICPKKQIALDLSVVVRQRLAPGAVIPKKPYTIPILYNIQ